MSDDIQTNLQAETQASEPVEWHRLSPLSAVFFLGKMAIRIVKDALPGLAPLAVLAFNSDQKSWIFVAVLSLLGVVILTSSILQYWFFRFAIKSDKVLVNQGVFKKKQRILAFERIQNINIIQPFYFRWFSLVSLQLETAGSKGNEAELAGIKSGLAETLKQTILDFQSHQTLSSVAEDSSESSFDQQPSEAKLLASASTKHLFQYGLTSNSVLWFLVFLSPFLGNLDKVLNQWIGKERVVNVVEWLGGGFQGAFLLGILSLVTLLSCIYLFSILGAIFRFYQYQLTDQQGTLKRRSGLLSTYEESAKLSKIQAIVQQTNFIGKWLRIEHLILRQASAQANHQSAKAGVFVIPSRTPEQSEQLIEHCLQVHQPLNQLQPIHTRYIVKTTLVLFILIAAISCSMSLAIQSLLPLFLLGLTPIAWWFARTKWKNYGYAFNQEMGTVRRGLFGYYRTTFPLFKVQNCSIVQTPLQARRGLATMQILLASERITIPYIPYSTAVAWYNQISSKIETTKTSWF